MTYKEEIEQLEKQLSEWKQLALTLYTSILEVRHTILKYADMDKIEIVDRAMSEYQTITENGL